MELDVVTVAERPGLEQVIGELTGAVWPAFMLEDPVADRHWGRLYDTFAGFQFVLLDPDGQAVAAGNAIPLAWAGTVQDLPGGWDDALARGADGHRMGQPPDTLCALAATVDRHHQGTGTSRLVVRAMKAVARQAHLSSLIAPVRPSWKSRYPLAPIERYVAWTRPDGSLFDPWLRVHVSEGGPACWRSRRVPWSSRGPSPTGRAGPACRYPTRATMSSPGHWSRWRSTASGTWPSTSSRTCGCTISCDSGDRRRPPVGTTGPSRARWLGAYRWELALVAVTAVWGSTFVLVRDAVAQIPPFTFVAYRFLAAAALLAAVQPRLAATRQPSLLAAGAVAGLALLSLRRLEVGRGDALVFGCAVAFAAHILVLGRYAPRISSYRLAVVQLAVAGLLALVWAAAAGDLVVPGSAEVWVALAITAVAASAGAFLIQTRAQREVSPTRTAVILTMEPVFAGLFGFLLAGERLSGRGWSGAGLILAGMLVAELGVRLPARPGRPPTDGADP